MWVWAHKHLQTNNTSVQPLPQCNPKHHPPPPLTSCYTHTQRCVYPPPHQIPPHTHQKHTPQAAGVQHNLQGIRDALTTTGTALDAMRTILARMPEKCDPLIYYKRVRLPASGWRNNPTLPQGLVYQGVSKTPMELYGATGAQSSVLPALDCALGVEHPAKGTPAHLSAYLKVMRGHMPRDHRAVLNELTVCVVVFCGFWCGVSGGCGGGLGTQWW